jgi:hypothetical protein
MIATRKPALALFVSFPDLCSHLDMSANLGCGLRIISDGQAWITRYSETIHLAVFATKVR